MPITLTRLAPAATPWPVALAAAALACVVGDALAQGDARAGLAVTASLGLTATATDNHRSDAGIERSDLITTVTPGIRLSSRSGRVQGSVDFGLTGVLHARDSADNNVQNRLAANVRAGAIPEHLDVTLTGAISRQSRSVFGRQAADGTLTELNQTELRSVGIEPVLRGVLGGVVAVQASANARRESSTDEVGATTRGAALTLSSAADGAVLGWSLNGTRQVSDFDGGRETTTDRAIASVSVRPDVDWQFTVRGGQERTDIASAEQRRYDNWGAGVLWTPSPRTRVSVDGDRRFFGNAWAATAEHRMRRTVLRLSSSRSVSDGIGRTAGTGITAYDLFFELFASQEPDAIRRDALVRSFLDRNGIAPDTLLGGTGLLSSAVTIQRRNELSLAVNGVRTSVVASVHDSLSERGDTVTAVDDDLADGAVTQQGLRVSLTHRLTPRDSLAVAASTERSRSRATADRSRLDTVSVGWSTRLSERSNLALSLRHSQERRDSDDDTAENALTASFNIRF